jgi:hypothetical protein
MTRLFLVALLPAMLAGCASTGAPPEAVPVAQVTDPSRTSAVRHRNPVSGYVHRMPSEPKSWECQNETQSSCEEPQS